MLDKTTLENYYFSDELGDGTSKNTEKDHMKGKTLLSQVFNIPGLFATVARACSWSLSNGVGGAREAVFSNVAWSCAVS